MPMCNLLEYSKNYKKATGSLWNYYRDEPNDFPADNYNANPITNSASFKYKTSIKGKTSNANQENGDNTEQGNTKIKKKLEIVVPLKHLSNFLRNLDMSLIKCEVSLTLCWSEKCVLTDIATQETRNVNLNADPLVEARERIGAPKNATFKTTDTKLYVPVVTLSTEDDDNILELLQSQLKRTIKWNKPRSEVANQTKTNNLNYLIDPTFNKVNRLFVSSFENEQDRTSFSKHYTAKVEIKTSMY